MAQLDLFGSPKESKTTLAVIEKVREKPFVIYRSSAGSGKTYTLVLEYLKLVLSAEDAFKHILAVTFTIKATEEMKGRVIEALRKLSTATDEGLQVQMSNHFGWEAVEVKARATLVLTKILHNYSQFSIQTIDSFFQKIIRSFAREIGQSANFAIEVEPDTVMDELVVMMFEGIEKNQELRDWLLAFADSKLADGKSWDFNYEVQNLGRQIFNDEFLESRNSVSNLDLKELNLRISELADAMPKLLKDLARQALEMISSHGMHPTDFSGKSRSAMNTFVRVIDTQSAFDFKKPLTATFRKWSADPVHWKKKKGDPNEAQIDAIASAGLLDLMRNFVEAFDEGSSDFISAFSLKKNIYAYGILENLSQKLEIYRQENDVILISDFSQFINEIIRQSDNDVHFIYEKVGSQFSHYLIDEFQDTSSYQWNNFRPLILNSLAEDQRNLLVGDIKQSIYRWRGADLNILLEKAEKSVDEFMVEVRNLNFNWRSDGLIIDFNNSFFAKAVVKIGEFLDAAIITTIPEGDLRESLLGKAKLLARAYAEFEQNLPKQKAKVKSAGFIGHRQHEGKTTEYEEWLEDQLPNQIEEIQSKGFEARDIAVLVRTNKQAKQVASFLSAREKTKPKTGVVYDVVSADSLFLSSSKAVIFIAETLRFLANQKDLVAEADLYYSYCELTEAVPENLNTIFSKDARSSIFEPLNDFLLNKDVVAQMGLMELVELIIRTFKLHEDRKEFAYLEAYQTLVLDFVKSEKADLHAFVDWWNTKGKSNALEGSTDINAVQVLTIHKSKGLQYPFVVMPFCNWEMETDGKPKTFWTQNPEGAWKDLPPFPLKYSKDLAMSAFRQDFFDERIASYLDSINLLYVAFTRAQHGLYIYTQRNSDKGGANSLRVNNLVNAFTPELLEGPPLDAYVSGLLQKGNLKPPANRPAHDKGKLKLDTYECNAWNDRVSILRRSKDYFRSLRKGEKSKVQFGLLVHDILAQIRHRKDIDDVLHHFNVNGWIKKDQFEEIRLALQSIFEISEMEEWFSGKYVVKNEVPVLLANGESRRLDKVIISEDHVTILDYKTGEKREKDIKQVTEYKMILAQMGYENIKSYLLYVENSELVEVA